MLEKLNLPNIDLSKVKKEYLILSCVVLIIGIAFFFYKNIFQPLQEKDERLLLKLQKAQMDIQKARISPDDMKKMDLEVREIASAILNMSYVSKEDKKK